MTRLSIAKEANEDQKEDLTAHQSNSEKHKIYLFISYRAYHP